MRARGYEHEVRAQDRRDRPARADHRHVGGGVDEDHRQAPRHTRRQVEAEVAPGAKAHLDGRAEDEQEEHVAGQMKHAAVDK